MIVTGIIIGIVSLAVGFGIGWFVYSSIVKGKIGSAEQEGRRIISEAEKEAVRITQKAEREAKHLERQARKEMDREQARMRKEMEKREEHLLMKENSLEKKTAYLDQRELEIANREKKIRNLEDQAARKLEEAENIVQSQVQELEKIAGLSRDEALSKLEEKLIDEARHNAAKKIKEIMEETKERSIEEAQRIIAIAIQRYAGEYVAERTVAVVPLPSDDMKGRIIGREGRNIRAFEAVTGVDIIIDDTPEAIVISSFDPIRREVARLALAKLIEDGRIHPARIEEVVNSSRKMLEKQIRDYGERAVFDLGLRGIHPELIKLIGQLRYRYSYNQNVWAHSIEVGYIAGMMAAELGLNVKKAKRAGLLHDIGKALTHEREGSHVAIGAELARKYGEPKDIVHAIAAHHNDVEPQTPIAVLIQAADALSGARPGARRELMEQYIKRLQDLEAIANGFQGVEKSYAIQAGRELRVIVQASKVNDDMATVMAEEIAKKIENDLTYPGQIKVTVIRETRAVSLAK